jgi:hypothetical protein
MPPTTEPAQRSWTSRYPKHAPYTAAGHQRQPFHNARSSLGAAGHLIHLGMVAAPLLIGELIQNPEQRWRAMRLVPVVGSIAAEGAWTLHLMQEHKKDEEAKTALEACRERCR